MGYEIDAKMMASINVVLHPGVEYRVQKGDIVLYISPHWLDPQLVNAIGSQPLPTFYTSINDPESTMMKLTQKRVPQKSAATTTISSQDFEEGDQAISPNGNSDPNGTPGPKQSLTPYQHLCENNERLPPSRILSHVQFTQMEQACGLHGHIVVVTRSLDDVHKLIRPLRTPHVYQKLIVIMCPIDAMGDRSTYVDWNEICEFPGVIMFQTQDAKPNEDEIQLAKLHQADSVIVTNNVHANVKKAMSYFDDDSQNFDDIDGQNVLLVLSLLMSLGNDTRLVMGLKSPTYGGLFERQVGSSLQGQAIIKAQNNPIETDFTRGWAFMSGMVVMDTMLDHLLAQAFYNPFITEVVAAFCFEPEAHESDERDATAMQIAVPEELLDDNGRTTYGEVFKFLLARDVLPFGLCLKEVYLALCVLEWAHMPQYVFDL